MVIPFMFFTHTFHSEENKYMDKRMHPHIAHIGYSHHHPNTILVIHSEENKNIDKRVRG